MFTEVSWHQVSIIGNTVVLVLQWTDCSRYSDRFAKENLQQVLMWLKVVHTRFSWCWLHAIRKLAAWKSMQRKPQTLQILKTGHWALGFEALDIKCRLTYLRTDGHVPSNVSFRCLDFLLLLNETFRKLSKVWKSSLSQFSSEGQEDSIGVKRIKPVGPTIQIPNGKFYLSKWQNVSVIITGLKVALVSTSN